MNKYNLVSYNWTGRDSDGVCGSGVVGMQRMKDKVYALGEILQRFGMPN